MYHHKSDDNIINRIQIVQSYFAMTWIKTEMLISNADVVLCLETTV